MELIEERIKELEEKMAELRKSMGTMYTMEMHEIDAQLKELHRLNRSDNL